MKCIGPIPGSSFEIVTGLTYQTGEPSWFNTIGKTVQVELNAGEKVIVFIQNVSGSVSYRSLSLTVKRIGPLVSSAKEEIETIKQKEKRKKQKKSFIARVFGK